MTDVLALSKSLHQRYEDIQVRINWPFNRRAWSQLPPNCQAEFIGIVNAVLTHQPTYNGIPVPQWVKDHIKERNTKG